MAVVASTERQADLEQQLKETGTKLAQKTLPVEQLLPLLDRVEHHLSRVDQSPPVSMLNALNLSLNALVEGRYMKHSDVDVKVAVASCISEITRITAPDAPYEDELMKDVFQLIVSSFEDLSDQSSRSYTKRASILETVAKVRSCVVMLDLECDELITKMFQHFLKAIRDYHPENVFSSMETIMTLVLEESENISLELLAPILATVKKDNENVLPVARKLGEKVFEKAADKLKPYVAQAVKSLGYPLEDYSQIVGVICNASSGTSEQKDDNTSGTPAEEVKLDKAFAEELSQAEASKLSAASSNEIAQVAKEGVTEGPLPEATSPIVDISSKSVISNGIMETENEETSVDQESLKKSDQDQPANEPLNVNIVTKVDNDESDIGKSIKSESKRGRKSIHATNSKEPSNSFHADSEKEADKLNDGQKSPNKDGQSSLGEDPSIETNTPSENKKDTDTLPPSSPLKALEVGTTKPVASLPSQSLPDESRSKKGGRSKKKQTSTKVDEPSTDVHMKEPEETSELEVDAPLKNENDTNTLPSSPKALEVEPTKAESLPDESRLKKGGRSKKKQSTKVDEPSTEVATKELEGISELEVDPPSETKNESDTLPSSPKALEVEPTKAESLPDESRSKKGARSKKKPTSTKADEPSKDVPMKTPEETSELEVKQQKRTGKKVTKKDDKVVGGVIKSKTEDGNISGSEGKTPKQASKKVESDDEDAKPLRQTVKKGEEGGNSEAKSSKQSAKKGFKSPLSPTVKKGDVSNLEAKSQKQSGKKGNTSQSVENKSSSKNKEDGKKRGRGQDAIEKDLAKSHTEDDKVSSLKSTTKSAKDDHVEEPNTTNAKRKRTPGKEKTSETAEVGANLVGLKIKVWWPKDHAFYDGVIKSYDSAKKKHTVVYTDDEVEILNLKKERWEFLKDGSMSDVEQATKDSNPNDASETQKKKKKAKTDVEPSPAQDAMEISPKRVGASSSSKLKAPAPKSGSKSNKVEEKADNQPKENTSKSGGKSKVKSKKSSGKAVEETPVPKSGAKSQDVDISTPKSSNKSKQEASKTVGKSKGKSTQSANKTNVNGSGKIKSSSSKGIKESDNEKESSEDSEKTTEDVKEKSSETISKVRESGTKSGNKRKKRN